MTQALTVTLGVAIFVVGVVASIALHEVGHLVPAKRFGVKCTQYMIGFGPTLWSRRRGETEYGVKAIPLGGYVRMLGMFPPKPGRPARADTTGRFALMIEQARRDANSDVTEQDDGRLFYQRSVPQKLTVMLGGPMMNLFIAVGLICIIVMGFGVEQQTSRIATVSQCVLPVGAAPRDCEPSDPAAPAAAAGLLPGDVIVSVDGTEVSTWGPVRDAIRASGGSGLTLVVERDGEQRTVTVTPIVAEREKIVDGEVVLNQDGTPVTEPVGFLGVSGASELVPQPITAVPGVVADQLQGIAAVLWRIPEKMVGVAKAAFGTQERDPTGPVSIVGVGRLAGEVGSIDGIDLSDRIAVWLSLLASLNLALFAFNLIPLLPLDGGHVAGALWEGLRRRLARLTGRPDPGPVDVAKALPLAYGVASILIGMSVLLIYADIVRPIRLNG